MISDLVDEEYNSVKTLSQTSVNGDVILKFITHDEDKQYIYIGITLKMELNQHLHTKNCKADLKDLEMTSAVNVNLKGEINGELDIQEKMHLQIHCLEKWEQKLLRRTEQMIYM